MPGFNARAKAKKASSNHAKGRDPADDAFDGCGESNLEDDGADGVDVDDDREGSKQPQNGLKFGDSRSSDSARRNENHIENTSHRSKGTNGKGVPFRHQHPSARPPYQIVNPPKPSHSSRLPAKVSHPSPKGFQFRLPTPPFPVSDLPGTDPKDGLPIITFLTHPTSIKELKGWTFVKHVERLGIVEYDEISRDGRYTGGVKVENGFVAEFGDVVFRVAIAGWGAETGNYVDTEADETARGESLGPLSNRAFKAMLSSSIGTKFAPPGFPFKIGPPPKKPKKSPFRTSDDEYSEDLSDLGNGNGDGWHTFDRYPSVGEMFEKVFVEDLEEVRVMIERIIDSSDEGSDGTSRAEGGYNKKKRKVKEVRAEETTFKVYRATFGILEFGVTILP